jgi:hypothetical protein
MQEAIGSPGGGPVDEANQNFMDHDNTKGSDAVVDTTAGKTCIPRFNHEPEAQGYALVRVQCLPKTPHHTTTTEPVKL